MFDPSFCAYIVGKRNSGKSHLLIQMLLSKKLLKGKFDDVIIINPTKKFDHKYNVVKFTEEYSEFSIELLEELLKKFEDNKRKDPDYKVLLILDDCISQDNFKNNQANNPLNTMAVNGRHLGISLMILSQKWNAISTYIRAQLDYIIFFEIRNHQELDTIYKEYGEGTLNDFKDMTKEVFTKPHDFLVIDTIHNHLYKNFISIK